MNWSYAKELNPEDRVLGRVGAPRRRGRVSGFPPPPPTPGLSLLHKQGQWGQHSALRVAVGWGRGQSQLSELHQ